MRKGKFKFTNKNGAEEQVALETLLDQIVDSPIRALMPNTKYKKGEIIFDKKLPLCFWVCIYSGMTGDESSLNVLKEIKSYGKVVECGTAMFIIHVTPYIPTMKTFDAYAKLESPHLTGIPTAPTASSNNNSTQIATTEFVKTALATFNLVEYLKVADAQRTYAPLNSPFFSGNPKAPSPNYSSDDNSLATTNFVRMLIENSNGGIVAANLNQNGYVKFANGLILQWGTYIEKMANSTTKQLALPIQKAFFATHEIMTADACGGTGQVQSIKIISHLHLGHGQEAITLPALIFIVF